MFLPRLLFSAALTVSALSAADLSTYRDFTFGASLASVLKMTGLNENAIRVIQQRPSKIEEIEWQPRAAGYAPSVKPESVREGVLTFLNGELYRITVNYDRYRLEGMTAEDVMDGVSEVYGAPTHPNIEVPFHSAYGETSAVLARWEDARFIYDLVRTGDRASYALVMYSKLIAQKAAESAAVAALLDAEEAPRRELERQKKADAEAKAVTDKNRATNKPSFKP